MLERLAAVQSTIARLDPLRRRVAKHLARAATQTRTALRQARLASKRALTVALQPVEAVLLSASGRERMHAGAVFALIFAFFFSSVDFLLTGGPDLGGQVRAAAPVAYTSLIAPRTGAGLEVQTAAAQSDIIAPEDIIAPAPRARVTPTSLLFQPELLAPAAEPVAKALAEPVNELDTAVQAAPKAKA